MLTSQAAIPRPTTKKTPKTPIRACRSQAVTGLMRLVGCGAGVLNGVLLR
jgi:hypothetical protein